MAKPWHRWPAGFRETIYQRDGYRCRLQYPGCTGKAEHLDHIIKPEDGGAWFDPTNVRASCARCNVGRRNREYVQQATKTTNVILVVGPPGAGKTTHVEQHRQPGDVVIDYDSLAGALGSDTPHGHDPILHSATMAARNGVLNALRRGKIKADRVWLISSNPRAEQQFPYSEVVVVDPGMEETLRRAEGRPALWPDLIRDWYRHRQPATAAVDW